MFWHILKVHGVQKHRVYNYNVHTYCAIDLWTSMTYSCCLAMQGVLVLCCMVQSRSLSTWHDPCMCRQNSCVNNVEKERNSSPDSAARACGRGGLYLAKQAKSGAAEPHEICSSSCTNLWMEFGYKGKKEDIFCAGDQQRIIPWSPDVHLVSSSAFV